MSIESVKVFLEENAKQRNDNTWYVPEGTWKKHCKKEYGITPEAFATMVEAEKDFLNAGMEFLSDKVISMVKDAKNKGDDYKNVYGVLNLNTSAGNTRMKMKSVQSAINPVTGEKIDVYGHTTVAKRQKKCFVEDTTSKVRAAVEKACK